MVFVLLTIAVWEFFGIAAKVSLRPSRVISLLSMWVFVAVTGVTADNWLLPGIVAVLMITTILSITRREQHIHYKIGHYHWLDQFILVY